MTMRTAAGRRDAYIAECEHIAQMVALEEPTTDELVSLATLLRPAYARYLAGREPLRLVRHGA